MSAEVVLSSVEDIVRVVVEASMGNYYRESVDFMIELDVDW
jgi:hypothetical protein